MWTTAASTLVRMTATISPPARRLRTDRRDLRLAVGVARVVVSVLLGARLLASAGDRVPVWTSRAALAAGTTLRADDLVAVAVASDALGAYVPTSSDVAGKVLTRAVGAGELVPAGALGGAAFDVNFVNSSYYVPQGAEWTGARNGNVDRGRVEEPP